MDIIFLSFGNPYYLPYVLSQCKSTNRNSTIHLLGDHLNMGYKGVNHHYIKDYQKQAKEFEKHYTHLSTNNKKFECFCFQRWFIINSFLSENNIKEAIVLDTDILVYDNIVDDMVFFEEFDMTLYEHKEGLAASPGMSFIKNTKILDAFCDFTLDSFKQKDSYFSQANKHFEYLQSQNRDGGVCDMTYFYFFYLQNQERIFDLHRVLPNNHYYDVNFKATKTPKIEIKKNENNGKLIEWSNNKPYGYLTNEDKIKYMVFHFQGPQKELIPRMVSQKGVYYWYNLKFIPFKNKVRALLNSRQLL